MKLENILPRGINGNEINELIDAIKRLPERTIEGISGYGDVVAEYDRTKDNCPVLIKSTAREKDNLVLTVPRGSVFSFHGHNRTYYFDFSGISYIVSPVYSFRIGE